HLGHVADPAAGTGALFTLTDARAAEAWGLFKAIEVVGGIGAALQSGRVQSDIANARAGRDDAITAGTHTIVGTTKYPPPDMEAPETLDGAKWPAPVFKDHPLMATPLVPHALHESGETP
ncbi:MAG: methylmalonyl-CoA mutase family protein, partial [Pseudomonadota bacterium]